MLTIELSTEYENLLQQLAKDAGKSAEEYVKAILMECIPGMREAVAGQAPLYDDKTTASATPSPALSGHPLP